AGDRHLERRAGTAAGRAERVAVAALRRDVVRVVRAGARADHVVAADAREEIDAVPGEVLDAGGVRVDAQVRRGAGVRGRRRAEVGRRRRGAEVVAARAEVARRRRAEVARRRRRPAVALRGAAGVGEVDVTERGARAEREGEDGDTTHTSTNNKQ